MTAEDTLRDIDKGHVLKENKGNLSLIVKTPLSHPPV